MNENPIVEEQVESTKEKHSSCCDERLTPKQCQMEFKEIPKENKRQSLAELSAKQKLRVAKYAEEAKEVAKKKRDEKEKQLEEMKKHFNLFNPVEDMIKECGCPLETQCFCSIKTKYNPDFLFNEIKKSKKANPLQFVGPEKVRDFWSLFSSKLNHKLKVVCLESGNDLATFIQFVERLPENDFKSIFIDKFDNSDQYYDKLNSLGCLHFINEIRHIQNLIKLTLTPCKSDNKSFMERAGVKLNEGYPFGYKKKLTEIKMIKTSAQTRYAQAYVKLLLSYKKIQDKSKHIMTHADNCDCRTSSELEQALKECFEDQRELAIAEYQADLEHQKFLADIETVESSQDERPIIGQQLNLFKEEDI